MDELTWVSEGYPWLCPDGEIGRHSGLKIRRPETVVGVQVPLRAPNIIVANGAYGYGN
jgi:hypothetical protein